MVAVVQCCSVREQLILHGTEVLRAEMHFACTVQKSDERAHFLIARGENMLLPLLLRTLRAFLTVLRPRFNRFGNCNS